MEINKLNANILSKFGQSGAVFGVGIFDIIKKYSNAIVLSADMSTVAGLDKFKSMYPDNFLNIGIAEQNMIGIAAGLSSEGRKVISVAQACFISMRSFEQLRQYAGYMKYPIISVGINAGFSLTYMGNTHYAIEDISIIRSIPGMTIISPSDAGQAMKAFNAAIELNRPTYIRFTGGLNCPIIYNAEFNYEIGKAIRLKEGEDVQIIATGRMVDNALKAASTLEERGISVEVIDMHTIKPLDVDIISKNAKMIVSIEEHSVIGGLGSAISDYLSSISKHPQLIKLGVQDKFSIVGDYEYLLEQHGLTSEHITSKIINEYNFNK